MDRDIHTNPPARRLRLPFIGLVTTRLGRLISLIVIVSASFISLYQPSWAIVPLRDLGEKTLNTFGASPILILPWIILFIALLRYKPLLIFKRWRIVLGSAVLVVATMGILAYFKGPLPLVDKGNLGGDYGMNILGESATLSYARVIVLVTVGTWLLGSGIVKSLPGGQFAGLISFSRICLRLLILVAKPLTRSIIRFIWLTYQIIGFCPKIIIRSLKRLGLHTPQSKSVRSNPGTDRRQGSQDLAKGNKQQDTLLANAVNRLFTEEKSKNGSDSSLRSERTRSESTPTSLHHNHGSTLESQSSDPSKIPSLTEQSINQTPRIATSWTLPSTTILSTSEGTRISEHESTSTAQLIETTLAQHGVEVEVAEVRPGPTVTMYGLVPGWNRRFRNEPTTDAEGNLVLDDRGRPMKSRAESKNRVKVDSILAREKDLALALAAPSLRIEAPVPGESVVGVEVPNHSPTIVAIRSVMESESYRKLWQGDGLPVALGQASLGETLAIDLLKMPHLLIAGATGSGKSVCIHSIIASLVTHQHPSKVRMLLVDPKRVELAPYNGIPHLVTPVVTEADQVVRLLKAAVQEMLRRYQLMEQAGVRNITSYNTSPKATTPIPYLVICIDELADLMMASAYDIEHTICRLAQLGRATGIHLVVATQRPSVDVVTGLIKANFPSRISFAVASQVDSRTILDAVGAERLLGRGDMLFLSSDAPKPQRVQGSFISEEETEALAESWRCQGGPKPPDLPLQEFAHQAELALIGDDITNGTGSGPQDTLFEKAAELASRHNQLSTSLLQRRLRIGYPRAARLMDQLEDEGIVNAGEPGKPRDVL